MALQDLLGVERASLVLMHPTALPEPEGGPYGVGELGSEAHRFLDFLVEAGVLAWQVLPLGHTGYGNSPYQTFSRYAGSPYLVSVEALCEVGDLTEGQCDAYVSRVKEAGLVVGRVDYGWLFRHKVGDRWPETEEEQPVLRLAFGNLQRQGGARRAEFESFCRASEGWLDDYAEFMALKELHGHASWDAWAPAFRDVNRWRDERGRLLAENETLARTIEYYRYVQFVFYEQWEAVRRHAAQHRRLIIGDVPWYVGYDSADVWAHPDCFDLDVHGRPRTVAGVPPDYFSATGQLWGNPVYRWWDETGELRSAVVQWWCDSLAHILSTVDLLRIDHFRAIDTFWQIPAGSTTAQVGTWGKGPGAPLLEAVRARLDGGKLPLVAEDLGYFDPVAPYPDAYPDDIPPARRFAVDAHLRGLLLSDAFAGRPEFESEQSLYRPRIAVDRIMETFELPWMGILQFGFEGEERFYPTALVPNSVIYTGTHDNDTSLGWYLAMVRAETQGEHDPLGQPVLGATRFGEYMRGFPRVEERLQTNVSWDMIEVALASPSALAGLPAGDLLCKGSEGRLNLPGDTSRSWWDWRATREEWHLDRLAARLRKLNAHYGRLVE